MMMIVLIVVLLCFCSGVLGDVAVQDKPLPMSTLAPSIIGNITISPSLKVNYSLELETSGRAVLDSTITFTARLWIMDPNRTEPHEQFRFIWLNSADQGQDEQMGGHQNKLEKIFDEDLVSPGDYIMTVIVYPKTQQRDRVLTFGNIQFTLTKRLNGNLQIKQNLEYQRRNNTFAVDKKIFFHVNITDKFTKKQDPQYMYFWYNGSQLIHSSDSPRFINNYSQPGVMELQAEATADFFIKTTSLRAKDQTPKFGTFKEKLELKAGLSNCSVKRVDSSTDDQSLRLGDAVIVNISCNGSAPSAVCWNVTALNGTLQETCKPPSQFQNKTHHQVSVSIGQQGWSTVHLAIYNDVSFNVLTQNYYVYDADTVNIPALVFPIVFIILGIVIATAGGTYIVRLRRKLHVEVADFDFDPNISVRARHAFSPVATAFKELVARGRQKFAQRQTSRSMLEDHGDEREVRRSHSLYESL